MNAIRIFLILLFCGAGAVLSAQSFYVYFNDKGENEALLENPYTYLSPAAIQKKAVRNVKLDLTDVPVSGEYLDALREKGFKVKMKSRWFNFAVVEGEGSLESVKGLPFVKKIKPVGRYRVDFAEVPAPEQAMNLDYGLASNQIEMVEGDYLHDLGYLGRGMTIAVLDGGFSGATTLGGLDSLWQNGQILGTYDFVQNDTDVFDVGSHGTKVLSIMGGWLPGQFAGSAVKANYWLLKSENEVSETVSEMYNWLAAAEFADSVGADVITSSLGYYNFDGGIGDYDYPDLDGNSTVVTLAADMAARKGMLVVVSAGNEGNSPWQKITAPADGDSVLAVGAVGPDEQYASFSSTGPTADGRIKPDVMAQGRQTAFVGSGGPITGSGTSFSCPIISGLAACLWQMDTTKSNMDIYYSIRSTAEQNDIPDNVLGYGIANFMFAAWTIGQAEEEMKAFGIDIYPNPAGAEYSLQIHGLQHSTDIGLTTYDLTGKTLSKQVALAENNKPISIKSPEGKGPFILSIKIGDEVFTKKIVR